MRDVKLVGGPRHGTTEVVQEDEQRLFFLMPGCCKAATYERSCPGVMEFRGYGEYAEEQAVT